MKKIKKGDEVIVIAGKDKGKRGTVLSVIDKSGIKLLLKVLTWRKNMLRQTQILVSVVVLLLKTMPIHRSNVMVYDPAKKKEAESVFVY